MFESLAKAGAFDSLAKGDAAHEALPSRALRPRLVAAVDAACEHGARMQRDRMKGRRSSSAASRRRTPGRGDAACRCLTRRRGRESEQLAFEKETLGLYWSGHPVDRYAGDLKEFGARSTGELADAPTSGPRGDSWGPGGPQADRAGHQRRRDRRGLRPLKTRKGDRMAVFTLEDALGGVEVIVFPEAFQRSGGLIETGTLVLVRGKLERDDESVRILASEIAAARQPCASAWRARWRFVSGCRPTAACSRRSASVLAASGRSAGVVRDGSALGVSPPAACASRPMSRSQIRVRPSPALSRGRANRRTGSV